MSAAQNAERAPDAGLDRVTPPATVTTFKSSTPIDFRRLVRRGANGAVVQVADATPPASPSSDGALDLLNEVSNALTTLMARCQELEGALVTTKAQAKTDIEAANEVAREWQRIGQALKLQVQQLERNALDLGQRLDAAEQQTRTLHAQAEQSRHAAAQAECLSSLFQERVISSFGIGSPAHSILETVRNRTQAMLTA